MKRTKSEIKQDLAVGISLFAAAHIVLAIMLVFASGCATMPPRTDIRDHQLIRGLVRISQMGVDCESQMRMMDAVVRGVLEAKGAPPPDKIRFVPLSGSSLCSDAQGTANEVAMPESGAYATAKAEVSIYWRAISRIGLQKAHEAMELMRPAQ